MSRYDGIEEAIKKSAELSGLLQEAAEAMREYVTAGQPVWQAERDRICADAAAAGKKGFSVPFRPESLIVESGKPEIVRTFLIAGVAHGRHSVSHQELAEGLRNTRDEYRNECKALAPAP